MTNALLSAIFWALSMIFINYSLASINADLFTTFTISNLINILCAGFLIIYKISIKSPFVISFKIFVKIALISILSCLIAGISYSFSIYYLGTSISAMSLSLYPAIASFAAYFYLKEEKKLYQLIFLILSIIGISLLSLFETIHFNNLLLGFIMVIITITLWTIELILFTKFLKDDVVNNFDILYISRISTALMSLVLCVNPYTPTILFSIMTSFSFIHILLAAFFALISYFTYYRSLKLIGASKTVIINSCYGIIALVLSSLLAFNFNFYQFTLAILVFIFSMVSVYEKN